MFNLRSGTIIFLGFPTLVKNMKLCSSSVFSHREPDMRGLPTASKLVRRQYLTMRPYVGGLGVRMGWLTKYNMIIF